MDTRSVVYFVQAGPDGPIKIGITTALDSRLRTLQTGSPRRLRLLHTESGGRQRELAFHRRWARHRLRGDGEWFHPAPEILAYITGHRSLTLAIPWAPVGRALAVPFVGAWALLVATLVIATLPARRRRRRVPKRHRLPVGIAALTAIIAGALWSANQPWWAIAAVALLACTLTGLTRKG